MATKQETKQNQAAKQEQAVQADQQVWLCDQIDVVHCDVSEKGIVYTVAWIDFMGIQHSAKFNREDCYFDFANVLKTLVKGGYRYNTMLPQVPAIIQQRLTAFRPSQESVEQAIKAVQSKSEGK